MNLALLGVSALLLPAAAFAQTADIEPCDTPQYAGTFVMATGELIPPGAKSFPEANTQVIYNNNADSGFFYGSADAVVFDEGRVPSISSPAPAAGVRNSYLVNGFQIAYCTREVDVSFGGPGAAMNVYFWEDYDDCADLAAAGTPTASFTLTGLPASDALETLSCWIIDIDLTGFEFCLTADADGAFDDDPDLDGFGHAYEMINLTATGSQGPLITGDPAGAPYGVGTFYQNPGATVGTGLDNEDLFYKDVPGGAGSGCFFFGGAPFAGFHMVITADLDDSTCVGLDCNGNGIDDLFDILNGTSPDLNGNGIPDECELLGPGTPYCFGVGCPCGNDDPTAGCINSTGAGALLDGFGTSSVAAGDLGFSVTQLAPNKVMLVALSDQQGNKPFFDGNLCLGGTIRRLWKHFNSGANGQVQIPDVPNLFAIGQPFITFAPGETWNFQVWFRDSPPTSSTCGKKANLTNGYSVTFQP